MIWRRTNCTDRAAPQPGDEQQDPLFAEAVARCRDARLRDVVWRHVRERRQDSSPADLDMRVHPSDQMLRHSLRNFNDPNYALSQYFAVALQQHAASQQLLRLALGDAFAGASILDFACGFGRSLRFMPLCVPRSRVWASDIQRDAVDFVSEAFGVNGAYSSFEPHRFEPGTTFDFIWVASLFSHLPAPLFHGWLARLVGLLSTRGVLCFSVHDARLLPPGYELPAGGLLYQPLSEIEELDARSYGTTFVSEAFVRQAIMSASSRQLQTLRFPRALANEQDVYVVGPSLVGSLRAPNAFRQGPWGWVDQCRVTTREQLVVSGWAASPDDGMVEEVRVFVDGTLHRCASSVVRNDVRAMLGDDRLVSAGFELVVPLADPDAFLEVSAWSKAGEAALLYAGPLGRLPRAGTESTN
jgi:SAM-dependent methyltransferase